MVVKLSEGEMHWADILDHVAVFQIYWADVPGYIAAFLPIATSSRMTMIPLRIISISTNCLSIAYGVFAYVYPAPTPTHRAAPTQCRAALSDAAAR